jgi:hypothetical protein
MIHNITWTAPTQPAPAGLLNSPDLLGWALNLLIFIAALFLFPQLRESLRPFFAPVLRFLAGLSALAVLWVWGWTPLCALAPILCVLWIIIAVALVREQLRRLAFRGWGELGRT